MVIGATPWVMYGFAPVSWDLPDGRVILIEVERCAIVSGMGLYTADIDFSAAFRDAPGERIRCRTDPTGPGVPETRFGCWTEGDAASPLQFWIAPGEDCPARHVPVARTLTTPSCWNGELTTEGGPIALVHGYLKSTGSPVGYVSWVSQSGALLAADIVVDQRILVYDVGAELPDDLRQRLLLLTVALSWWEHASQPD